MANITNITINIKHNNNTAAILKKQGGKEWIKEDMHRLYFNQGCAFISSLGLSNRAARSINKLYYNVNNNTLIVKGIKLPLYLGDIIKEQLKTLQIEF